MSTILTNYIKNEIFGAKNTEHLQNKMLPSSSDLKQVSYYKHIGGNSIFANTGWFYSRSVVHSHLLNAAVHYSENYFGSIYTKAISGVQFSFYITDTLKLSSLGALWAKSDTLGSHTLARFMVSTHYYGKCAYFTRKTGMTIDF